MLSLASLALVASLVTAAQEAEAPAPPPHASKTVRLTFGAEYGRPLKLAGSLTAIWGAQDDTGAISGFLAQVEGGQGGGKASLGYGFAWLDQGLPFPVLGGAIRACALRTWGTPRGALPATTFGGFELDLNLGGLKGTIGHVWRIAGASQGAVTTWGVGVGF
jgi:hypothetical protein